MKKDLEDVTKEAYVKRGQYDSQFMKSYAKVIGSNPLLAAEEEWQLVKRIEEGDRKALDRLINSNLRLVLRIAKKFSYVGKNAGLTYYDIVEEGYISLINAAKNFKRKTYKSEGSDQEVKLRFSTYATECIEGRLKNVLKNLRQIKIPLYLYEYITRIKTLKEGFEKNNGYTPTFSEIIDLYSKEENIIIPDSLKEKILRALIIDGSEILGLERVLFRVRGKNSDSFEDESSDEIIKLRRVLDILSMKGEIERIKREKKKSRKEIRLKKFERVVSILKMRYGLNDMNEGEPMTTKDIAKEMDISNQRVSQIEEFGKDKIRWYVGLSNKKLKEIKEKTFTDLEKLKKS
ncbi:sigma-70 family RNA polymerase sigma factor [Candidatus Woesearchaeota archaeon]|nr:sigma-70 family RNA polymerase sigma factor [Candidatus Woesearchaeota archaeon]